MSETSSESVGGAPEGAPDKTTVARGYLAILTCVSQSLEWSRSPGTFTHTVKRSSSPGIT